MVRRLVGLVVRIGLGCACAVSLGGCPDGADLENPERFPQYGGGTTSTAGTSGAAGTVAGAGMGGGGSGGASGSAGSTGVAGGGGTGVVLGCDIVDAMKKNCARAGCHGALDHYGDLDFSNLSAIGALMVDKPALHGDITCDSGPPARECTPEELATRGCPTNVLLIDSKNFDASWVVKKLTDQQADCGQAMPAVPGNSASNGWSDARRQCFLDYFRSLIPAP